MTTPLPPYGTADTCAKCRHGGIDDHYRSQPPTQLVWTAGDMSEVHTHSGRDTDQECLLRTCQRCGWAWLEACADADADPVAAEPSRQTFYDRIGATPCAGTQETGRHATP